VMDELKPIDPLTIRLDPAVYRSLLDAMEK
jgi:hypothetical protein